MLLIDDIVQKAHIKSFTNAERTKHMDRPVTTLFMLASVDGKISTGGKDTPTLIDGRPLTAKTELSGLGVLQLEDCTVLRDSYIRLRYKVVS